MHEHTHLDMRYTKCISQSVNVWSKTNNNVSRCYSSGCKRYLSLNVHVMFGKMAAQTATKGIISLLADYWVVMG